MITNSIYADSSFLESEETHPHVVSFYEPDLKPEWVEWVKERGADCLAYTGTSSWATGKRMFWFKFSSKEEAALFKLWFK